MRLCITGGGTGGHLNIAKVLCKTAVEMGHEVIFIGSTSGQDEMWFKDDKMFKKVYFLNTSGVVNQNTLGKLKAMVKILRAVLYSRKILKENHIQAVISVGGFSSAAAALSSFTLKTPLFIHEQNAVAGKLNSLLRPYAKLFLSAYETSDLIQGYPVGEQFFNLARTRNKISTVIFLGGSQGALAINNLALHVARELNKRGIKIIHQCGIKHFDNVKLAYDKLGIDVELYSFCKDLPLLIKDADLAVSRAGASTLWELCANGLPALFVPYPYAASNHQFYNAKFIVDEDMGWCAEENEDLSTKLLDILDESLQQKSKKLMKYSNKNTAAQIIKLFEQTLDYNCKESLKNSSSV